MLNPICFMGRAEMSQKKENLETLEEPESLEYKLLIEEFFDYLKESLNKKLMIVREIKAIVDYEETKREDYETEPYVFSRIAILTH